MIKIFLQYFSRAGLLSVPMLVFLSAPILAQPSFVGNGAIKIGNSTESCTTGNPSSEGLVRYNSADNEMEFCDGSSWKKYAQTLPPPPPSVPADYGYFVLTQSTWDGNLGGIEGARDKCVAELTANTNWMGYNDANTRGLLTHSNIKPFQCKNGGNVDGPCYTPIPQTTYYFARAGDNTVGGATLTTNSIGQGPNNGTAWSGMTYFGGTFSYWSFRSGGTATLWGTFGGSYNSDCNEWKSNSSGDNGPAPSSAGTTANRWSGSGVACNNTRRLICFVDP